MAEKAFTAGRGSIVPYVSVEPYFDSRYQTVNRWRVASGGVKAAVIPAQSPQVFTLAVPLPVELMTNVAVR